jgi:hypothetical protein
MNRSQNFYDFDKLVNTTVKYLIKNKLNDLTCGPRTPGNHFEKIVEEYFGKKCYNSQFDLYTKWNNNRNRFREIVLNYLKNPSEKRMISKDFYEINIRFSEIEWIKLLQFRSETSRPKFLASSARFFNEKFKEKGIFCWLKFVSNNFSIAQKEKTGHYYWSGTFKCSICENKIFSYLEKSHLSSDGALVTVNWNGKSCPFQISNPKSIIKGPERDIIKNEICSKGITNFRTEAMNLGKFF